jgi:hypothetical protein
MRQRHHRLRAALQSALAASLPFLLFCIGNTAQPEFPDPIEFESVWQYLKVYSIYQDSSIYQDRIPEDPFLYSSPEEMLESFNDTLRGHNYTDYIDSASYHSASLSEKADEEVTFRAINDTTGLIRINSFSTDVTYKQFLSFLPAIESYRNLIVDLRGNTGGDIEEMDSIIEAFLPAGKEYILARERKYDKRSHKAETLEWHPWVTKRAARKELEKKNITVYVNDRTASASEILAAALKDCYPAKLVGQRTYGKAIGQIILQRRDHRPTLQITYLQLRRINGDDYHRVGIQPDSLAFTKQIPALGKTYAAGYKIISEDDL